MADSPDNTGGGNGEQTAGTVVGAAAPLLNFVPYVGPILSAAASIGSGLLKSDAAKKQMQRAQELRNQQVPLQNVNPNYQRKLRMDEMAALAGMPGYEQNKQALDDAQQSNIRAIRESSPDGNATLAAMAAALHQKNQGLIALAGQNAAYRAAGQDKVSADLSTLGQQGQYLSDEQRQDKQLLNSAATNLENAGTANKVGAADQILSSVGALGSPKAWGNGGQNPAYIQQLKAKGYSIDANGNLVKIAPAAVAIPSNDGNNQFQPADDVGATPDNLG